MREINLNFSNQGKIVGKLGKVRNSKGLVILVHGFIGSIDGPAGTSWIRLSKALMKANFDVYRFSFRFTSSGWKDFHKMTIAGEVSDLKFILKKFSKKYKKIALVGESLGGAITIIAYNKKIRNLVLWYPAIETEKTSLKRRFESKSALKELKETGYVTVEKGSTGESIRIGRKLIWENRRIKLWNKLKHISCPTLIISPDKDTIVPFWQSKKALKFIGSKNKN